VSARTAVSSFDDSLCNEFISICPRCKCDADVSVDDMLLNAPWGVEQERQINEAWDEHESRIESIPVDNGERIALYDGGDFTG
jgi:hypothetical protein